MNHLIGKTLLVLALKPQLATALFLAAGVSGPLGQAAGIINGFGLVGAFGGLVYAGWSSLSGRIEQIKYGLMGSALCGLAWAIVNAMFTAAVPIALAIFYVAGLKLGKPKSYDMDFFRSLDMRLVRFLHRTGLLRSTLDLYAGSGRKSVHPYHES